MLSRPDGRRMYLPALTSMRFLAALHVVIYHYFPMQAIYPWVEATRAHPALNLLVRAVVYFIGVGYIEVALFFILSGFILAYTYLDDRANNTSSIGDFAVSRLARIYPVYLCAWACAGLYAVVLNVLHKGRVVLSIGHLLMNGLTSLLCIQSWNRTIGDGAWNGPGWSISAELFFYALFAVMFLRPRGRASFTSGRFLLRVIVATLLLKVGATVTYFVVHPDGYRFFELIPTLKHGPVAPETTGWQDVLTYSPLFRVGEFMLGVGLARLFMIGRDADQETHRPIVARWPAILVLGVYAVIATAAGAYLPPLALAVVLIPIQALVIYRLASPVTAWTGLISAPMILLGEASYALYLFHDPLLSWVEAVAKMHAHSTAGEFPFHLAIRLPCAIAAIVLSIIVYRFIEVPCRTALRNRLRKHLHSMQHQHIASPIEASIATGP